MIRSENLARLKLTQAFWPNAYLFSASLVRVDAAAAAESTTGEARLVASFDCTKDFSSETFFELGNTRIAQSQAGPYREADAKPESRFGYRFTFNDVDKPHIAIIRYPDDKRRFMCVMDGTCYDFSTGVFTDQGLPVSGRMLGLRRREPNGSRGVAAHPRHPHSRSQRSAPDADWRR